MKKKRQREESRKSDPRGNSGNSEYEQMFPSDFYFLEILHL